MPESSKPPFSYVSRLLTGCQLYFLHSLPLAGVAVRFGWISVFCLSSFVPFHSTLAIATKFRSHTFSPIDLKRFTTV